MMGTEVYTVGFSTVKCLRSQRMLGGDMEGHHNVFEMCQIQMEDNYPLRNITRTDVIYLKLQGRIIIVVGI